MIPVQQRICAAGVVGAVGMTVPGDCVKCCVASILELPYEDVPHFVAGDVTDANGKTLWWLEAVNHWMCQRGYPLWLKQWTNSKTAAEVFKLREERGLRPGESMPATLMYRTSRHPDRCDGYWIASVISENFEESTHAIVMLDDNVAFDPSMMPRRTPYEFIGGSMFGATDPARCLP